jgi:hypothetical protein
VNKPDPKWTTKRQWTYALTGGAIATVLFVVLAWLVV